MITSKCHSPENRATEIEGGQTEHFAAAKLSKFLKGRQSPHSFTGN